MLQEAPEPPLPIDPETVRRIFSGQAADESGLDAMVQLTPAESTGVGRSGTFYMMPLPVDPEDLRSFGFWTYEFREGHTRLWSTAQGRYGRPLRVTRFQHPSPHLICAVEHGKEGLLVTAPHAVTVDTAETRFFDLSAGDPQTRIWFMLYAQVLQSDGASYRNILLDHARGVTLRDQRNEALNTFHGSGREPRAGHGFPQKDIEASLALLGLPRTSPLSVLAVELLPGPLTVREGPGGPPHTPSDDVQAGDPLGTSLGLRRIMRTSPLTPVPAIC